MKNILLKFGLLMLLSGCSTPANLQDSGVNYIGGKSLAKRLVVENINNATNETGTVRVWASLRNKMGTRLAIDVRAVFLGDKGAPVESEGAWRQVFIEQGTASAFEAYSQSTQVKRVTIQVREANK